jgi:GNAT superfamily N-acetyltransferase
MPGLRVGLGWVLRRELAGGEVWPAVPEGLALVRPEERTSELEAPEQASAHGFPMPRPPAIPLVLFEGKSPVACAGLVVHGKDTSAAITGVFVVPECRGRGLGGVVIRAALAHASALGARTALYESKITNRASLRAAKSAGFRTAYPLVVLRVGPFDPGRYINALIARIVKTAGTFRE